MCCWKHPASGLEVHLSWEGARTAHRCQVRDLLPFASITVMQFAGFGVDAVPDTQVCSKLPTKCILHVPCLSSKPEALAASFSRCSLQSGASCFSRCCCWVQLYTLPHLLSLAVALHYCALKSSPFHRLMVKPMSSLPLASVVAGLEGYVVKFNLLQKGLPWQDGRKLCLSL